MHSTLNQQKPHLSFIILNFVLSFFSFVFLKGVLGLLSIPSALVFTVGMVMKELPMPNFAYNEVSRLSLLTHLTISFCFLS